MQLHEKVPSLQVLHSGIIVLSKSLDWVVQFLNQHSITNNYIP